MYIGEALDGDGNEIAHIDLMIGSKTGPVGIAFANALSTQSEGHSNLLAVITPNVAVKPSTVMVTKVTIKGMKQAVQMFGPAQAAVAKAVADSCGSSRRSGLRLWCVHSPRSRRQQKDLRLQLQRHQNGDRECHEGDSNCSRNGCQERRSPPIPWILVFLARRLVAVAICGVSETRTANQERLVSDTTRAFFAPPTIVY